MKAEEGGGRQGDGIAAWSNHSSYEEDDLGRLEHKEWF